MSVDLRKRIIKYLKENSAVKTTLGDITIESTTLGEGGTAVVYSSLCHTYAIKFLVEDISNSKESQVYLRFKQEFFALFELSKTNNAIAKILDIGSIEILGSEKNGEHKFMIPFIVMKRYSNSLKISRKSIIVDKLNILDSYFFELLDLVEIIHSKNIIHRDIKPENIFIDENKKMVLGDFGIAWFDKSMYQKLAKTSKADRLANFNFSAPEQSIPGTNAAFTMDIFAIGQMLQWYVTGKTIKGSGSQKISDILGESAFHYDVIIEKLIQENPSKRPQNIESIRQLYILEKNNSRKNWLIFSNKYYRSFVEILQDWTYAGVIPNPTKADSLLVNLHAEILQPGEFLFLLGSIFFSKSDSNYFDYYWNYNLNTIVNCDDEDILEPFEVEFARIGQDGVVFEFEIFGSDNLTAKTDNFDLYYFKPHNKKERFACIYSEITNNQTGEEYLLLVLNDPKLSYRLKKQI